VAWYDDLLAKMGAPDSNASQVSLQLWAQSEGVPASWNNWLATTIDGWGGVSQNSDGVKAYPTEADGVDAIYATLQGSAYQAVIDAFVGNEGGQEIWDAVNGSPWCAGCQNDQYPVALYDYLQGKGGIAPAGGGQTEPTIGPGSTGRAVRVLQRRLNDLGHNLAVTGVFDANTENTVKAFQAARGLTVDGIVGPQTWAKLLALTAAKNPGPPAPVSGPAPPNESPAGVDSGVLSAWSNLKVQAGPDANGYLQALNTLTHSDPSR